MTNMLCESAFFGVVISLLAYELGMLLKKKFGFPIFNPLLISIAVVIVFLAVFDIDYQNYNDGAKYLSYLLTPATVCLAIPLYEQMEALKKNIKAILAGILSGVLTSLTVVLALALIFNLNHKMYVTLLPKSITTAIGMGVSEELGGYVTITVATIVITGVLGNIIGEGLCKLFHIEEPIAKGVALGEALKPAFKTYQQNIVKNAKALADELIKCGFDLVSGGTDNHLMLVDLRSVNLTGKEMEHRLDEVYITVNKNAIPFDPQKPFVTSGIRIGTPAATTRGFDEADFREIAKLIYMTATQYPEKADDIRAAVTALCDKHPLYQ